MISIFTAIVAASVCQLLGPTPPVRYTVEVLPRVRHPNGQFAWVGAIGPNGHQVSLWTNGQSSSLSVGLPGQEVFFQLNDNFYLNPSAVFSPRVSASGEFLINLYDRRPSRSFDPEQFLVSPSGAIKLESMSGQAPYAYSVNASSIAVGKTGFQPSASCAWIDGLVLYLDQPTCFSEAFSVSDGGVIIGSAGCDNTSKPVYWSDVYSPMVEIPTPPGYYPQAINNYGTILLRTGGQSNCDIGPLLFDDGVLTPLDLDVDSQGRLSCGSIRFLGMSDDNAILATATLNGSQSSFVWHGSVVYPLTQLVDAPAGITYSYWTPLQMLPDGRIFAIVTTSDNPVPARVVLTPYSTN